MLPDADRTHAAPAAADAALPRLAGALPLVGHMVGFARNPVALMQRVRAECGPVGEFRLLGKRVVLLSGAEAQEAFCRAPDEQLSQKIAYRLMTPIFGEGVVFDAPAERLNEQLRILMPALRDKNMRTYAGVFVDEVEGMTRQWGEAGEIDLLDFTAELTTYTSSHCLLGAEFRHGMNEEFARVYGALEKGVNAIAYVNPYLPLPVFRRRDRARARLVEMITENIARRRAEGVSKDDALQVLMDSRYSDGAALTPNEITGILTASMFAGHHTSSGTAAWTLIELLRNPTWLARVVEEVDRLHAHEPVPTYQSLREVPVLEGVLKEVLRLHPPLVILMRGVLQDLHVAGTTVPAGTLVAISPPVSHHLPELFVDPERFDPERYAPGREEDATPFAWIPFGGGHHRCSGAAFAFIQLKAITASLLKRWTFELVDPPASYDHDYTKMVVQPRQPCRVRYRRRVEQKSAAATSAPRAATSTTSSPGTFRVKVDLGLCQGHAVCMSEAPEVFHVAERASTVTMLNDTPSQALRDKVERAVKHCPTHALSIEDWKSPREVTMPAFPRQEMEEMMRRWIDANARAEAAGDWKPMAEFYTEDAEYTWNLGPNEDFVARGRQEIRDWVLGTEMEGLEGWQYPYDRVLIDDKQGEVVAFWRQVAPASRPDGSAYEIRGVGGSWFRYAGGYRWGWQRDFFDFGNAMALFMELIQTGQLSPGMQKRIERVMGGELMPGHVKRE